MSAWHANDLDPVNGSEREKERNQNKILQNHNCLIEPRQKWIRD